MKKIKWGCDPIAQITLSKAEIQSGLDRVRYAELLILQLPSTHDGRNTWLLNYGMGEEAVNLRRLRGVEWHEKTRSAKTVIPCK